MLRTLIYASLVFAWNASVCAQVLDVRELNTEQIARLDRARTLVLMTAGILEEHGPFLPSYSDGYQSEFIAMSKNSIPPRISARGAAAAQS